MGRELDLTEPRPIWERQIGESSKAKATRSWTRGGPKRPLLDRIAEKIEIDFETGCWLWLGAIRSNGYANIGVTPTTTRGVHRVLYELVVAPIPDGLDAEHLCRVRHCVNPDHIEPVTRSENVRRGLRGVLRHAA